MPRLKSLPPTLGRLPDRVAPAAKIAEDFYTSPAWRGLIARIKRECGNRCQRCGAGGRIIGDHIVERKDGGDSLDARNVQLLCLPCHNGKTAEAKRTRVR